MDLVGRRKKGKCGGLVTRQGGRKAWLGPVAQKQRWKANVAQPGLRVHHLYDSLLTAQPIWPEGGSTGLEIRVFAGSPR